MKNKTILGIDIGGTGMKGAIIDIETGELLTERLKIATPKPASPTAVADVFCQLVENLGYQGELIGVGFPAIVKYGIAKTAANIDKSWIGVNIEELLSNATGKTVKALNDADAAGIAEMNFGGGKDKNGVVVLLTIGTGIGSALFVDGKLVPNSEMGHSYMKGQDTIAEKYCANSARKNQGLDWKTWGARFNEYLNYLERLFVPDLFILGGGVSKKFNNYKKYFKTTAEVTPAEYQNAAGVIGAAMYAAQFQE